MSASAPQCEARPSLPSFSPSVSHIWSLFIQPSVFFPCIASNPQAHTHTCVSNCVNSQPCRLSLATKYSLCIQRVNTLIQVSFIFVCWLNNFPLDTEWGHRGQPDRPGPRLPCRGHAQKCLQPPTQLHRWAHCLSSPEPHHNLSDLCTSLSR